MTKVEYEEITLTSNAGGTGTTDTTYGTFKNVFLLQIVIDPDDTAAPDEGWDLTIVEETTLRAIYANASMSATTLSTATIRDAVVNTAAGAIANEAALIPIRNRLACSGANMGTSETAVLKVYYLRP